MFFVTIASESGSQVLCDLIRHAIGRVSMHAWMVLWSAERVAIAEIATRLRCRPKTVKKWLRRFARGSAAALTDLSRSGRPPIGMISLLTGLPFLINHPEAKSAKKFLTDFVGQSHRFTRRRWPAALRFRVDK